MSKVQSLFEACKVAFKRNESPSAQALEGVQAILDTIKPSDVGLDDLSGHGKRASGISGANCQGERSPSTSGKWSPPITYLHLYECDDFSIGIFCLPASASIPLHNHPGMTVLSKIVYGTVHTRAFDWVDPHEEEDCLRPRLASLVEDDMMSAPCPTDTLYPTSGGNIHAFTAITACAVLDVLAPPYNAQDGRHCTYFRELPRNGIADGGKRGQLYSWLQESQPPEDFMVQRGLYQGPKVIGRRRAQMKKCSSSQENSSIRFSTDDVIPEDGGSKRTRSTFAPVA